MRAEVGEGEIEAKEEEEIEVIEETEVEEGEREKIEGAIRDLMKEKFMIDMRQEEGMINTTQEEVEERKDMYINPKSNIRNNIIKKRPTNFCRTSTEKFTKLSLSLITNLSLTKSITISLKYQITCLIFLKEFSQLLLQILWRLSLNNCLKKCWTIQISNKCSFKCKLKWQEEYPRSKV